MICNLSICVKKLHTIYKLTFDFIIHFLKTLIFMILQLQLPIVNYISANQFHSPIYFFKRSLKNGHYSFREKKNMLRKLHAPKKTIIHAIYNQSKIKKINHDR